MLLNLNSPYTGFNGKAGNRREELTVLIYMYNVTTIPEFKSKLSLAHDEYF